MLARFYCSSVLSELTSSDWYGDISKCGDTVEFVREPRAVIHKYKKNQKLEVDHLENEPWEITITEADYFNVKLDNIDMKQICNSAELMDKYTKDAIRQLKEAAEIFAFAKMMMNVDCNNMGCNAGVQSQDYDLGDVGRPFVATGETILQLFTNLMATLMEACVVSPGFGISSSVRDSIPFIILPVRAYVTLMNSELSDCCTGNGESRAIITGRFPNTIGGFKVYFSDRLIPKKENGSWVYPIIAGRTDATAAATHMMENREVEHPDYFGSLFQGMMIYGADVIYPEALALALVRFE